MKPNKLFPFSVLAFVAGTLIFGQSDVQNKRFAIVISMEGKGFYSAPGGGEGKLRPGLSLPEGAKLWTESGTAQVYFRQIGSIIKLLPDTQVSLEKLDKHLKDGYMIKETVLGLNRGRILTRARVLLPESRFEVHTPVSTFSVPDVGYARYDIRADGTAIVGKKSKLGLRAITGGKTNQVMPGTLVARDGKTNRVDNKVLEQISPQLDELEELADSLTPPPGPQDAPKGATN
jgi:hypothetical protein